MSLVPSLKQTPNLSRITCSLKPLQTTNLMTMKMTTTSLHSYSPQRTAASNLRRDSVGGEQRRISMTFRKEAHYTKTRVSRARMPSHGSTPLTHDMEVISSQIAQTSNGREPRVS